MIRSEATPDLLIGTYLNQLGEVYEWNGVLRLKWVLNSAASTQMDEETVVLRATQEKNKTL